MVKAGSAGTANPSSLAHSGSGDTRSLSFIHFDFAFLVTHSQHSSASLFLSFFHFFLCCCQLFISCLSCHFHELWNKSQILKSASMSCMLHESLHHALSVPLFPPSHSLSSPGVMIKVAGMSLCSTAEITEEQWASGGGREGGKSKGSGVAVLLYSNSSTLPPSGPEVHNDFSSSQNLNLVTSPKCREHKSSTEHLHHEYIGGYILLIHNRV